MLYLSTFINVVLIRGSGVKLEPRKINLTGGLLIVLFVIGILFASKYSPGKNKLATICLTGEKTNSNITQALAGMQGIKTVFLDPKSEILTFRYDSSQLTLNNIKEQLKSYGLKAQSLQSLKFVKKDRKLEEEQTKLFKLDFSPSAK